MKKPAGEEKSAFPMRINKYLAMRGYSTRRGADELIERHRVYINGRVAELGAKVNEKDTVEVRKDGKPKAYVYFAYHKPRGIITHSPQGEEQDIRDAIKNMSEVSGVFPVGRLDKDSYGLIILTNDGRITDRLLNPKHEHEKEYKVKMTRKISPNFTEKMSRGVDIGDYVTKPCKVARESDFSFRITLGEGKKHQIRRMVDALGNAVTDLERIRIMNIKLAGLAPGVLRKIEGEELAVFLKSLGL